MSLNQPLKAGGFSKWLEHTHQALRNETSTDVPCGTCNACCRSSYFIHIKPTETETLSEIPEKLLFPAPGLPEGHLLMGYDEHGRCPMLANNTCSIYEHRPMTCRTYDCRVFTATGIKLQQSDKYRIEDQVKRWNFDYSSEQDEAAKVALNKAARFLEQNEDCFEPGELPGNRTQLAILAVKVYEVFLDDLEGFSTHEIARKIMSQLEKFPGEH